MVYEQAVVLGNQEIGPGHHLLTLKVARPLPELRAGQFANLRCDPADRYSLLRPFSILDADPLLGTLSIYYKQLGRLSSILAGVPAMTRLDCLYPLGSGFPWREDLRRVALVGGGTGLAPLLFWARQLEPYGAGMEVAGYFGGATAADLVPELLGDYGFPMHVATVDGSAGFHGTVVELFAGHAEPYDAVYVCGPNAMMAALQQVLPPDCQAYASLEEYMACGVGACLGCAARIRENGAVVHRTVCKDGPVFDLRQVEFAE